jgi:hypothetical protein
MSKLNFVLPYEPQSTAHREAQQRHQDIKQWLRRRERQLPAPSIVPDHEDDPSLVAAHGNHS